MLNKQSRQQLAHSCAWIREHWDTNNHEVPDDLLETWIYSNGDEREQPSGYHFAVFIFGYINHKMKSEISPAKDGHNLALSQALSLFQAWQCKLALSELHRHTELKVSSSALFEFPEGEEFKVWR